MSNSDGDIVSVSITSAGSAIPDTYSVMSVRVYQGINRITYAEISLLDGNAAKETMDVSEADTFVPGAKITIAAGYDSNSDTIFEGIVTKQALRIDPHSGPQLTVECQDAAIKMTTGRNTKGFKDSTDSDAISTLIGNYSDLSADVTSTDTQLPMLMQYYSSDWDFMLNRAEINGLLVSTVNGKVSVFKPDADTSSVLTITYGDNLYAFDAELDATTQLKSVKASAWD